MKRCATGCSLASLACLLLLGACHGWIDGDTDRDPDEVGDPDVPGGSSDRTLYFYYGPMKLMNAESILYSIERITGHDFGGWDATAPDPGTQAFSDVSNNTGTFYPHCRLLGGCMEHRIPLGRTSFVGTAFVLQLEKAVAEACGNLAVFGMFPGGVAPTSVQAIDVIRHQYLQAFGTQPAQADLDGSIAYFDDHLTQPELTTVGPLESAGRGHCRALLTTNRFLFF